MNLYNLKENYHDLWELLQDLEHVQIPEAKQRVDFMKKLLKESKSKHEQERIKCDLFVDQVDLNGLLKRKKAVEDEMNVLKARIDQIEADKTERRAIYHKRRKLTLQEKKERKSISSKAYYQANKKRILENQKSPHNRPKRLQAKRDYYWKNREQILAKLKKVRDQQKEENNDK